MVFVTLTEFTNYFINLKYLLICNWEKFSLIPSFDWNFAWNNLNCLKRLLPIQIYRWRSPPFITSFIDKIVKIVQKCLKLAILLPSILDIQFSSFSIHAFYHWYWHPAVQFILYDQFILVLIALWLLGLNRTNRMIR